MKPLRNFFAHNFHHYRFLVVAAISLGGSFTVVMPSLADGTTAGTTINNTATADYNYVNNLGVNVLNKATSNTVTVSVAEIAGITVTSQGMTDTTGGSVVSNDLLYYDFLITNVGNDPTRFFIPGKATITGSATAGAITADLDGNGTFETTIPNAGLTTSSIPVSGFIKVRVPVTVNLLATAGSVITVLLGDTSPNDNSNATQNQPDSPDGSNATEVRTVDNPDGTPGETAGIPLNGEREASAIQTTTIFATPQAFAKVLKVRSGYSDSGTPNNLSDDKLTYDLSLKIDSTSPTGSTGLTPANLVGTSINVDGVPGAKILVSDAIPLNTHLASVVTPPTGWSVVYTVTPTLLLTANNALWTTIPPADLTLVTRIGFVNSGTLIAGTTVNGLSFQVVTNGVLTSTATIYSIAQSFGQTQGDAFNQLVYDESGDQSPSNFNDDGTVTIGSNIPNSGIANVTLQGADTSNNNTGQGPGGEVNTFTITAQTSILNGPHLFPNAVGATDNNNDFSNQSAIVPLYLPPGSTIDPAPVSFLNTILNPNPTLLSSVLLVPVTPTNASDLPSGTTVTLTSGVSIATYTYNGTVFTLTSGLGISLPTLNNLPVDYIVTVDLPAGTPLSTDTGKPFPVTIRAFVDSNNDGAFNSGESYNNTIDQVYTGFLKLVKESRLLQGSGPAVATNDSTFSTTAKKPGVGNIIEYRITYTNISSVPIGSNNATLNAIGIIITENGNSTNNNWAKDNDNNGKVDTSHVFNTAIDPAGIVTYLNLGLGVTDAIGVDITTYLDTIPGPLQPGQSGTFTFQRKLN
ncbi:MAG: hypothetical protein V7K25_13700 [Nostoc sp.]|uniref:beta strand repeat-containing protein n=1 Tax=Nostoc sp. TaxID=1180 RepID=UPI002FF516CD